MLSVILANIKVTTQAGVSKSQKTSGNLGDLWVDDWQEKRGRIGTDTLYWYSVTFKEQTEALLDSESEINIMSPAFASQLGLKIRKTNIRAQKLDGTTLETYRIIVSIFFLLDKDGRKRFFEESFLLADVKPEIVFRMAFLIMSNADIDFQARNL